MSSTKTLVNGFIVDVMGTEPPEPEEPEQPPLSPQAEKILTALRDKPDLLLEIAGHFAHGWPIEGVLSPWHVRTTYREANLVRTRHDGTSLAGVCPFTHLGHDGTQWEGAVVGPSHDDRPTCRIFDDPQTAAHWVDANLAALGYLLAGPPLTPALLTEYEEAVRQVEATRIHNADGALDDLLNPDDIPF